MSNAIRRITEAFSMQPSSHRISTQADFDRCTGPLRKAEMVQKIILETLHLGYRYGDPIEDVFYVGYSFTGQRLFQYLVNSVNVEFEAHQESEEDKQNGDA